MEHRASACDGKRIRKVARAECSSDYGFCNGVIWYGGRGRILESPHLTFVASVRANVPPGHSTSMRKSWQMLRKGRSRQLERWALFATAPETLTRAADTA
jgi:hypothetical protein